MAHIILTGATGCAGAAVLQYALNTSSISRISILSRRPVKLAENQPKANVIIHQDFEQYPKEVLEQLQGATGCRWAQGISSVGISEADYKKITISFPTAAAEAFSTVSDKLNFVYFSGEGADMEGNARRMYGRIKGECEKQLLELGEKSPSLHVYAVRPGVINPRGKYLQERKPTLHDRLSTGIGGIFEMAWKKMVIPTDKLAKACTDLAIGDGEPIAAGEGVEADGRLLRNTALRRLAGM